METPLSFLLCPAPTHGSQPGGILQTPWQAAADKFKPVSQLLTGFAAGTQQRCSAQDERWMVLGLCSAPRSAGHSQHGEGGPVGQGRAWLRAGDHHQQQPSAGLASSCAGSNLAPTVKRLQGDSSPKEATLNTAVGHSPLVAPGWLGTGTGMCKVLQFSACHPWKENFLTSLCACTCSVKKLSLTAFTPLESGISVTTIQNL